ncbi:hypothetical protein [Mannheimia bovis]|uniref:Uncharacterized protein n=1 Tax=Mannheimia bovis TaxID=2770636 RepID=A0A7H1C0S8_9PAST|nr:hypothetical protein [Mannheimia bovis]QNS14583.1 hypothetical protein ICJ55_07425 [Mannheimia bovis]
MKTLIEQRNELEAFYHIANYDGKPIIGSLIYGIDCLLEGHTRTVDAHDSNKEELKERINQFYENLENYLFSKN